MKLALTKSSQKSLFILVTIFLLVNMPSASADTFQRIGALKCDTDRNTFIIRFGLLWNDDAAEKAELSQAPPTIISHWSTLAQKPQQSCQLSNGKQVSLSIKVGQSFAHGMGGANPDASFTLTVGQETVYFENVFFQGYSIGKYAVSSVFYKEGALSECSVDNCIDVSNRLAGDALSAAEVSAQEKASQKKNLKESLSPFCEEIRTNLPPDSNDSYEHIGRIPSGHLYAVDMDINNDGKTDKVFRIAGSSHYFDGSYLIVFTGEQEKITDFLHVFKKDGYEIGVEPNIKFLPEWGAYFISMGLSGSSARYVHNVPFAYKDKNYIYTTEHNKEKIPSTSISLITPNNQSRTVCEYP